MSIALALHAGPYVMLASDTRRTFYDAEGCPTGYHDGTQKCWRGAATIVAGVGVSRLLDAVCGRVAALSDVGDLDLLLNIIAAERARVTACSDLPAHSREHARHCTGWFMSARVPGADGALEMALLTYHPGLGHEMSVRGAGTACPMIPIDDTEGDGPAVWADVMACLSAWCRLCGPNDDVDVSIAHNAAAMRAIVTRYAEIFPTISPTCVIGVHLVDGTTREVSNEL